MFYHWLDYTYEDNPSFTVSTVTAKLLAIGWLKKRGIRGSRFIAMNWFPEF